MVALERTTDPGGPHYQGLIRYRGRVLPVYRLLSVNEPIDHLEWFLVICTTAIGELAVIAQEVTRLIPLAPDLVFQTFAGRGASRVAQMGDDLVRVLDPTPLLDGTWRSGRCPPRRPSPRWTARARSCRGMACGLTTFPSLSSARSR